MCRKFAAVGPGIHRDIDPAAAAMARVGEVRDPSPADCDCYDKLEHSSIAGCTGG